jgi:transposase
MKKALSYKSWTISDKFWEEVKSSIPKRKRDPNKTYKYRAGGGRKALEARRVLEGILYCLRTGCQWKAIPREYGAASSIHQYFQEWIEAGFFIEIWKKGLEKYDEIKGIAWEWQSLDGSMVKAPIGSEQVGPNPTDRGKKWDKALLVNGRKRCSAVNYFIRCKYA